MAKIQLRLDKWEEQLAGSNGEQIFVTTTETVLKSSTVHSRMFAPALGISEDPATGSASGPLGAYLLRYALAESGDMISEQGFEMGRRSLIQDPNSAGRRAKSQRWLLGGNAPTWDMALC